MAALCVLLALVALAEAGLLYWGWRKYVRDAVQKCQCGRVARTASEWDRVDGWFSIFLAPPTSVAHPSIDSVRVDNHYHPRLNKRCKVL